MSSSNQLSICVLIPVLNEMDNIKELVDRLLKSLDHFNAIITFIDDGSIDGTMEYLVLQTKHNKHIRLLERKKTKAGCQRGGALYYGLKAISKERTIDIWIELDGDLSHQPEEIPSAISKLIESQSDVLIVSKYCKGAKVTGRPWVRNIISKVNSLLFRLFIVNSIKDFSNGFRVYTSGAADVVLKSQIRYSSPIYLGEVLVYWLISKAKIIEHPGLYLDRAQGNSSVRLRDVMEGFMAFFKLLKLYKDATKA